MVGLGMLSAKQFKLALLAVGLLMVVNLSFPPWVSPSKYDIDPDHFIYILSFPPWVSPSKYSFIMTPPVLKYTTVRYDTNSFSSNVLEPVTQHYTQKADHIDWPRLGLQSLIILVIGAGVYFGLRPPTLSRDIT